MVYASLRASLIFYPLSAIYLICCTAPIAIGCSINHTTWTFLPFFFPLLFFPLKVRDPSPESVFERVNLARLPKLNAF